MPNNRLPQVEVRAFENINNVIDRALEQARRGGNTVLIKDFNGVDVEVHPDDFASDAYLRFKEKKEASAADYRESKEYKTAQEARRREVQERQERIDQLVMDLSTVISHGCRSLGKWLADYIESSDHVDVCTYESTVLHELTKAGFYANDCVGNAHDLDESNDDTFVRYIVGQMLQFFKHGMPAHPALATTINKRVWQSKE